LKYCIPDIRTDNFSRRSQAALGQFLPATTVRFTESNFATWSSSVRQKQPVKLSS